ncbi:DUF998 domain-containing protein [Aeromicrobium choanae]|uniref:Hypothetical membrane protein n=1 Tax=Aeromicrobium choanae TaxID=1736691 RepID=A0A1T4Z4J6_9ACTN|nr:DUF998 domain-containing protein [Aeromicrobium choanae]SKB08972.1 hypothetical membrane protein [Aeromicrobium choanae]
MPTASRPRRFAADRAARWGALALVVRPLYIGTEILVAAATIGGYDFLADTVSRLGEIGCSPDFCSPRHAWMNGSFVVFGVLLTGSAVWLARRLGPWAAGLLVIAGLSSIATGLTPQDQAGVAHAIAATPLFIAQPAALLVLAARVRGDHPHLSRLLFATGAITAAAAVGFVLAGEGDAGLLERLALWPVVIALSAFGVAELRSGPWTRWPTP